MDKQASDIDWSQLSKPLSSALFDKYSHQSVLSPLDSLTIDESTWNECRAFALKLAGKGFTNPLSILYTSFKRLYPHCPSISSFARWLALYEKDTDDFKDYFKQCSTRSSNIQPIAELIRTTEVLKVNREAPRSYDRFNQIWFLFSISIRVPVHDNTIIADALILNDGTTRLCAKNKKHITPRMHCLFAVTPSGKFSNQLITYKQGRGPKMNFTSSSFTRITQTSTGDIGCEHVQQWFEDFISLSYGKNNSAILIDPRTTLLTPDVNNACEKSNIELITTDLNYYLIRILAPIFTLFDERCSEANRLDKMYLKSASDLQRIIYTIWCSLRTLKQNEQICQIFKGTSLWRNDDEFYLQSLRSATPLPSPKKKKKKSLVKTGSKTKLSSSVMMTDPPNESTPDQILSYVIQRQLSISRASKFLGGTKLDYLKYCLSYKSNSALMTGSRLVELNTFMQSQATVHWLRRLRSLHFWPCAKQLFLREIYHLTGIITRKRSMNMCANGSMGSNRSCDLQSPSIFWRAFEDIHQIQFDNESIIKEEQWHDDFQQYLCENKLNRGKTQLWTVDTFEFPLTKKSTVLQLPEWNELRPMNLTPKVSVLYAFSNTGQSTEPCFIFPNSLHDNATIDEKDFYNELGHLTPQVFLTWLKNHFAARMDASISPMVLLFCSRLPVLSSQVLSSLEKYQICPYGYPHARTLPFRYMFERRVRNNRSTNLISELWKKKLLEEQHTHVLKGSTCTVANIKHYFAQIWSHIINEESQSFEGKCQQAFQQANIHIKLSIKKKTIKLTPRRTAKQTKHVSTAESSKMVDELNRLITVVNHMQEQVMSTNAAQILKINDHVQQTVDTQLTLASDKAIDNTENVHLPSTPPESESSLDPIAPTASDKRALDDSDESQATKRLRSSSSQASNSSATTTVIKWTPPSEQFIAHVQSQSASLFQFILSLVNTIYSSAEPAFTDEHSRWIHSKLNLCGHDYNPDKIDFLIATACQIAETNFVR